MNTKKELKHLIRSALAQGWRYEHTRGNHHKLFAPNGKDIVVISNTPSDYPAFKNCLADMRRAGYREQR